MTKLGSVLAIDASTSGCKALIFDESFGLVAEGRAAYPLHNPEPGAWQQDPADYIKALDTAIGLAVRAAGATEASKIVGLSIAHQRETFVAQDDRDQPLHPAVVWMDSRAAPEVEDACRELDPQRIHELSGKVPCTTPSLYKIRALVTRIAPEAMTRCSKVVDVHAYLAHHLGGEYVTSLSSADPLGLVGMQTRAFEVSLCELARIKVEQLPRLVAGGTVFGELKTSLSERWGLPRGVKLCAGAGDGQAAGLGAHVVDASSAYLNLGTALVSGRPHPKYVTHRAFRTLFAALGDGYLLETDLLSGTLCFDWLATRLLGRGAAAASELLADLEQRAAGVVPGSLGLLFLPYLAGVMNPYWDAASGGALLGLRADHGPEHVYRAICEGLAFEQRLQRDAVEAVVGPAAQTILSGGLAGRALPASIFADVLCRPLQIASSTELTARGAAVLAMVGTLGADSADRILARIPAPERSLQPGADAERYDALYVSSYRELYPRLKETLAALAKARG